MSSRIATVLHRNMAAALRKGDLEQAESILEHLKREDPLSVQTRGLELEYILESGRLDEASALSSQLLNLFPTSPRIHYIAGLIDYRRRDYPAAELHLTESQRLHPHWRTEYWIGRTLTQAGRFEEAEATLLRILPQYPGCRMDLAWLYERKQDFARALQHIQAHVKENPRDARAAAQLERLRARSMSPADLQDEVETLIDLGEDVSPAVLPEYLETLLRTGQGSKARAIVQQRVQDMDARLATRLAWTCYSLQAYDMALQLFMKSFAENRTNFKFLAAIEAAADRCGRLQELIRLYRANAAEVRSLYGRIQRLDKRLRLSRGPG
ncbi:MAG: tetratricopeptide repeat protein [Acidobacteriota bacterium]